MKPMSFRAKTTIPIEMHATIAAWDGDRLTLWDKTQWVHNTADRDRRRVRHSGEERPRHHALRWRRLRGRVALCVTRLWLAAWPRASWAVR